MIGMILFLLCVYVILVKKYRLTQTWFLGITITALACLLIFFAFAYYVRREISAYDLLRAYFVSADTNKCVVNTQWAAALSKYVAHTSLGGMNNVLLGLLITYGLLFVVGVLLSGMYYRLLRKALKQLKYKKSLESKNIYRRR